MLKQPYLWLGYPKCSTCQKAKGTLESCSVSYTERNIKEDNPSSIELKEWSKKYGIPPQKFFNTSGLLYREMHLKEKVKTMSEEEMFELLGSDGMLVKRPILITEDEILIGYREEAYRKL